MTEKYQTRKEIAIDKLKESIDDLQSLLTVIESSDKVDFQTRNDISYIEDKIHIYHRRIVKRLVVKLKKQSRLENKKPLFTQEQIQTMVDKAIEKAKQNEQ